MLIVRRGSLLLMAMHATVYVSVFAAIGGSLACTRPLFMELTQLCSMYPAVSSDWRVAAGDFLRWLAFASALGVLLRAMMLLSAP